MTNARDLAALRARHRSVIEYYVPIKDEDIIEGLAVKQGRQWWTRTLYLNSTPFDVTLQLDSDRTVCSSIEHLSTLIRGYDMLHVSAGILPAFDNGVMVYRNNAHFQALHGQWLEVMERNNKTGDDQRALTLALNSVSEEFGFKSGVLPPTYQLKLVPAVGEQWATAVAAHTLVLTGDVKIVAGGEKTCELASRHAPRPRVVAFNKSKSPAYATVLSQGECSSFLDGRCRTKEVYWNDAFDVMSRAEYLYKFTPV